MSTLYLCRKCGEQKTREFFRNRRDIRAGIAPACKACHSPAKRKHNLQTRYGLTPDHFKDKLTAQAGCCAICGSMAPGRAGNKHLVVDHDHSNGRVRGLLCHPCNKALGCFKDDVVLLEYAKGYLINWRRAHETSTAAATPLETPNATNTGAYVYVDGNQVKGGD